MSNFLAIPIYKKSPEEFEMWLSKKKQNYGEYLFSKSSFTEKEAENLEDWFKRDCWYPWQYNDVVGYVSLEFFAGKIVADHWKLVKLTAGLRTGKKKFQYSGKIFDVYSPPPAKFDIQKFKNRLYADLEDFRKAVYSKQYIDYASLDRLFNFFSGRLQNS